MFSQKQPNTQIALLNQRLDFALQQYASSIESYRDMLASEREIFNESSDVKDQ